MNSPGGFIEFGAEDESIILSCRPNSLTAVAATGGALAGTTSVAVFDESRGFYQTGVGTGTAGLRWAAAAVPGIQELLNHGHITLWCEPEILDGVGNAQQEVMFMLAGTTGGTTISGLRQATSGINALHDYLGDSVVNSVRSSSYGRTGLIPITYSWNRGITEFYIDDCLIQRKAVPINQAITGGPAIAWLGIWASARVATPGQLGVQSVGGALHSFHISNRPISLPMLRTPVVNFGDSFTSRGGAPGTWCPHRQITSGSMVDTHGEAGYVMGMRRMVAKHGRMMPLYNCAVGGTQSDEFANQVAVFAALGINEPWVGTVMFGINDASLSQVSAATYETRMIAGLDAAFAAGARSMVVIKPSSPVNNATYNTQQIKDLIDEYGAVIDGLRASYNIVVGDAFTTLGGHATNNPLLQLNDVHPNNNGQMALSRMVNPLLEKLVF